MSKALSSKAQNFKTKGRSSDSFNTDSLPIIFFLTVAKDISVSFYELTAAGLFGIFTQFPFNLCVENPLRLQNYK
jgi:hypothetical protein